MTWTAAEVRRVWLRAMGVCATCENRPPGRQPSECPECWGTGWPLHGLEEIALQVWRELEREWSGERPEGD